MEVFNFLGIQDAYAETTTVATPVATTTHAPNAPGGIMSLLPTIIIFALVFYFLLIRPQTKRSKEHRKLMESIAPNDDVVTTGGLTGKVVRVTDNYIVLAVSDNVEITFQKNAIAMILPKGTLKAI